MVKTWAYNCAIYWVGHILFSEHSTVALFQPTQSKWRELRWRNSADSVLYTRPVWDNYVYQKIRNKVQVYIGLRFIVHNWSLLPATILLTRSEASEQSNISLSSVVHQRVKIHRSWVFRGMEEWTLSTFIPLPKKGDLKQCANYRTIALVSQASKVLLRIILERIRVKTEMEIADEQAEFRQGRGTRDQITNLRILMHTREHQQPLYMCFVDFEKVFDSISHDKLWVTMMDMGYPLHLIDLLAKLYRKQLSKVKVAGTLSEWFLVKKGVRQGCVLGYLFNILVEMVMRETLDGFQGGLQIGGRMSTNLCYADNTSSCWPPRIAKVRDYSPSNLKSTLKSIEGLPHHHLH